MSAKLSALKVLAIVERTHYDHGRRRFIQRRGEWETDNFIVNLTDYYELEYIIPPFFLVLLFYSHSLGTINCEENETVNASPASEYTIEKFTDHRSGHK